MMKITALGTLAIVPLAMNLAYAEEQKPEHEVTYNASIVSDYRYRGRSQTRLDPALQGGADYTHNPTGLYVGTNADEYQCAGVAAYEALAGYRGAAERGHRRIHHGQCAASESLNDAVGWRWRRFHLSGQAVVTCADHRSIGTRE